MKTIYLTLNQYLIKNKGYRKKIRLLTKISILPFLCLYPLTLLFLFLTHNPLLFDTLFKPLFLFVFISLTRRIINRSRPFEVYPIKPVTAHKKGSSFPSRHTSSAFIITFMFFNIHPLLGIFLFLNALLVGLSRILGGLHFISDVFFGFLLSLLVFLF